MILSLTLTDFREYVINQMNYLFPDNQKIDKIQWRKIFDIAVDRIDFCFKHVTLDGYYSNGKTYLNHLHSDQYAMFLWFLSNTTWNETENKVLSNKLFYMNKVLHGLSCMYDTKLPDIFLLLHVVGTVLGKGVYSDFFVATQGCTVGAQNGKYPRIGRGVSLLPNSSVIGECIIGNRVSVGINATVYKTNVSDNTTVYVDQEGNLKFKNSHNPWSQNLFNESI